MTKGTTDSIRFYYAMLRKGLEVLSSMDGNSSTESSSSRIIKDCAKELGIEVEDLVDGAFELKSGKTTKLIATLGTIEKGSANWLCSNKYATFEILRKYGFQQVPYYKRYSLETIEEARQDFITRRKPVVIKPSRGTYGGTGVTANIKSVKQLNKAIFNSLVYHSNYLMEDFVEGDNFRISLFNDRVLNAVQRLPANVKGDGVNNIKHLIEMENERRAKDRSIFRLNPILIDNEVKQTLRNENMSLKYIPEKDEMVFVRTICNHHAGGEIRDVTNMVHQDIMRDCRSIMKIMGVTLGGIDIITKDISKSLAETGGTINEVNTDPALDIHGKDATIDLLNLLFEKNLTS